MFRDSYRWLRVVTGGNKGLGGLWDLLVFTGVYRWVG